MHEGSPVGDNGWKVVIRTDLLYEAEGFGEFAPSKKRKLVAQGDEGGIDGDGISKMAKIVDEASGTQVGETMVPKAVGLQHAGDGLEGNGG